MYDVRKRETSDEAKTGATRFTSPLKFIRIIVVAIDVFVKLVLMLAAKQRQTTTGLSDGKRKTKALPNAAPTQNRGKIKPPRNPPAIVKEIATNLNIPTITAFEKEFISKPIRPDVGKT